MSSERGEQPGYVSYMLRAWRVPMDKGYTWRASLEEPHTQKIHHFKELSSLFAFLQAQIGQEGAGDGADGRSAAP